MRPIIKVNDLSKQYRIGVRSANYQTLRETVAGTLTAPLRWAKRGGQSQGEIVWALKDVGFEIFPGEIVGLIGRNGAGKSTLLKILSRITEPTFGRVDIYGRIGSLLEVGTGFHPELTGRENIFLNGAILGMKRAEIARKFDEIVAFAEIDKYLDTPVKFYSSGMYMRLAFAVAAHLEPEILLIDEVLAVGDLSFQKKCLGKMNDVAKEGRTVLFVSHNMAAVRALCTRGLFMQNGELVLDDQVESAIGDYLSADETANAMVAWDECDAPQTPEIRFRGGYILNDTGVCTSNIDRRKDFTIVIEYEVLQSIDGLRIGFLMQTPEGVVVCSSNDPDAWPVTVREPGRYVSHCRFPGHTLNAGTYLICLGSDFYCQGFDFPTRPLVTTPYCLRICVEETDGHGRLNQKLPGLLRPKLAWEVRQEEAEEAVTQR